MVLLNAASATKASGTFPFPTRAGGREICLLLDWLLTEIVLTGLVGDRSRPLVERRVCRILCGGNVVDEIA